MLRQPYVGKTLLVIFLLTLVVFVLATQSSLWDLDESLYARIACEMLQSGEWRLPTMNGHVFSEKPPFTFWAMAACMASFGVNPVAARLPAVFSFALTGWLVFLLGRELFSPRVGFWSSAILMSSVMTLYLGSAATLDAPLLAFISLAMWAYLKGIFHPKRWIFYWPVLALALGLAELTKHPVGMATVAPATFFSTWMLRKEMRIPKSYWLGLVAACLAGYALYLTWFIPVCNMAPGFAEEIFGRQVIGKIFAPMQGHGADTLLGHLALLPVYAPMLLVVFLPWSVFLPAGVSVLIRHRVGDRISRIFLISWALPIFVLFSLAATKLPHYIFPLFPPVALLTAASLESWRTEHLIREESRWLGVGAWLLVSASLAFGILLCFAIFFIGQDPWRIETVVPGVAFMGLSLTVFRLVKREKVQSAARVLLVGMPLFILLAVRMILPGIEPLLKISPVLAENIRAHRSEDEPIAMCGYREASFVFYMNLPDGQSISDLDQHPRTLQAWLNGTGTAWLVVYDSLWKKMMKHPGAIERTRTRLIVPVLNYNDRAKRDRVRVVQRLP
jgi:4-amino-4-deoxy-L-arabinose transferase-like glycosyltransferase